MVFPRRLAPRPFGHIAVWEVDIGTFGCRDIFTSLARGVLVGIHEHCCLAEMVGKEIQSRLLILFAWIVQL